MSTTPSAEGGWSALLADVDQRYAAMNPPSWPDPHENHEPDEEEYSRITDRRRFALPRLRVTAWADALIARGLAQCRPVAVADGDAEAYALEATRPDTLRLLVSTTVEGHTGLSIEDPQVLVWWGPDCGCDACDRGSELLFRDVEEILTSVVAGTLEVEQTDTARIVRWPYGAHSGTHGLSDPIVGTWQGRAWVD